MPDLYFVGSGKINLSTSQLCTLALNTASKPRIALDRICVSFDGTSSTATPVNCIIARITNTPSGSAIPSNYGPNALDPSAPTAATTAACPSTASPGAWTTPPTQGAIVWEMEIPPATGLPEWYPLGQEIRVAVSAWIGVFLTAGASVNAYTSIYWSE